MAGPSAAETKARRAAAGYWQGASSANGQPRCDNCRHVRPKEAFRLGLSKYDRLCSHLEAPVKTHGCCKQHERAGKA